MKKAFFAMLMLVAMSFASCGNSTHSASTRVDSVAIDSAVVDTDSVVAVPVDSAVAATAVE